MSDRKPCICGSTNLNSRRNPFTKRCNVFCEDCGQEGPIGNYETYVQEWNRMVGTDEPEPPEAA